MPTTFSEQILTLNKSFDPAKDHICPTLRSLNMKDMKSPTAIAGQTGSDCKLIHGDRWQQIDGKFTEQINEDQKTDIMKNEEWTVHEDYTMHVHGKTKDTRDEDVKETYYKDSYFEYWLEHTDKHHEADHQINPTHKFDILNVEGEYKSMDLAITAFAWDAKGTYVGAIVAKAEGIGAEAAAFGAKVEAGGFENAVCANSVQEKALDARLDGIDAEIKGIHSHMGGPKVLILPIRIGLCIAIHIDSPWA